MSSPATLLARPDDTDDVRWAVQTALVQLKQGGPADAIVWVKRAAEAAEAAGNAPRGAELRAHARQLAESMWNLGSTATASASAPSLEIEIDVELEEGSRPPGPGSSRPARPASHAPGGPPPLQRNSRPQSLPPPAPVRGGLRPPPGARGPSDAPVPGALPPRASAFPLTSTPTVMGYPVTELGAAGPSVLAVPGRDLRPSFNDRLSSVDIEPLSVDSVLPQVNNDPLDSKPPVPVSVPPGPDSLRRALALIDDEEILAEDEDQRVTQDFGILSADIRASTLPHGQPHSGSASPRASSAPPASAASGSLIPSVAPIAASVPPSAPRLQLMSSLPPGSMAPGNPAFDSLAPQSFGLESLPPQSAVPQSSPSGYAASSPSSYPTALPPVNPLPSTAPPPSNRSPGMMTTASAPPMSLPPSSEPFLKTPSSRPPEVARFTRRAPPSVADSLGIDLGELILEVSDLAANAHSPAEDAGSVGGAARRSFAPESQSGAPTTRVDGVPLEELRGFEDLPEQVQRKLAASVRVEALDAGDEVGFFGAAVVTAGTVDILPAISDDSGAMADRGDVVFTQGSLSDSVALRVVAKIDGTRVAVWDPDVFSAAIAECSWVHDELRFIADYFVAVCGAALGPLGERLDSSLRTSVFKRLEVRALQPGEVLLQAGASIPSLFVVGGGRLEVLVSGEEAAPNPRVERELTPGGFVFADRMMSAKTAPASVRAGPSGALVLFAPRAVAHELMMSVPPLLEVLAG